MFAVACLVPSTWPVMVHFLFTGTSDVRDTPTAYLSYFIGLLDLVVIAMQVTALLWARSSIRGDRVSTSGMAWARRMLMIFNSALIVAAVALLLIHAATGFGIGLWGSGPMLYIAGIGFIGRARIRKIERHISHADPGTRRPPPGDQPPHLPPYTPR